MTHLIVQCLRIGVVAALLSSSPANADMTTLAGSPFVAALKEGKATAPPPQNPLTASAIKKLQERTGSNGPVTMVAFRIARFQSQPKCGRVGFGLLQESTHSFWGQFGGQLNVCEDGTPPLKMCRGKPAQLVLADHECADKTRPVDTAEVEQAIKKAMASGSMTIEQFRASMKKPAAGAAAGGAR